MDLPPPNQQVARVQQQRPDLRFIFFMMMMFWMMQSNGAQEPSLVEQVTSGDMSAADAYANARSGLLRREARREGIARWLGVGNQTGEWLNSTYFPEVANGTAPPTSNDTAYEAYRIENYAPHSEGELKPVPPLVREMFAEKTFKDEGDYRLYQQNLTGFVKGLWHARSFSFEELGLNETWEEKRVVVKRPEKDEGVAGNETAVAAEAAMRLLRRQNNTASTNVTIVVDTFNRTSLRGSFPWLSSLSADPFALRKTHPAMFNLRSLQTSATGPILPLPSDPRLVDEGELLRMRPDDPASWESWEKEGPAVYVGGQLSLSVKDEKGADEDETIELDIEAIHLLSSGRVYGYATPTFVRTHMVDAIYLPLMSSSSPSPNRTASAIGHTVLKEYTRRLVKGVKDLAEADRIETSSSNEAGEADPTISHCIFALYGALSPLPASYTPSQYAEWYSSLFHPTGSSIAQPARSTFSAVLSSTNCGLVLSVPSAVLSQTSELWDSATRFAGWLLFAHATVLILTVRQLERVSRRPGTVANVAPQSIAGNCIVDAYVFVTLLTIGIVTESRATLPILGAAFLALLSSLLFGTRYIALIREGTPDRPATARAEPVQQAAAAAEGGMAGVRTEDAGGEREGTVVRWASRQVTQWRRRDTILAVSLGCVAYFAISLLMRGWTPFILWIIYSNWIPQILLNVYRGTARQSLANEFVVGTTIARLFPPLYFWAYEGNCLLVEPTPKVWYLAAYSVVQATVLVLQSLFSMPTSPATRTLLRLPFFSSATTGGGARFFLPKSLIAILELPSVSSWNYHPRELPPALLADLTSQELETGAGDKVASHDSHAKGAPEPDCPICLSPIQVLPTKDDIAQGKEDEVRMAFAITPCGHVVHTECLEQWMMVRAICPVCRASLPALAT
ncbi:zinc finger, RING-type protein [Rhodotorula toruloides]|uniref:RING-type E3 ubiquitin transferase n=1 Tax=Rhodotorula toruloides TaxID=5286 RepID=A0A511KFB9_RHOTO|nr:zinc finger, RING-type protein [Rhodotorula toruloides]